MSLPSSTIKICKGVKLNKSYHHAIWFSSSSNQVNYFEGKVVKTLTSYSYLRKTWDLKVDAKMEDAREWGYLFFRNTSNGKYYFYFIDNIEYVNDNMVNLQLELDVLQTYLFDFQLLKSFVEREHTNNDTVGSNILDEGLEIGDLKVIDETTIDLNDLCVLVLATFNPLTTSEENTDTVLCARYNGVFSGLGIYAVNMSDWVAWGTKLNLLDTYGKSDGIVSMWMYPKNLVVLKTGYEWNDGKVTKEVDGVTGFYQDVKRNTETSGVYTPRNKKLLTYPFNFLYVSNNAGTSAVYKYEHFGDPDESCNFRCVGALGAEGQVKLYPLNYNGVQHNYEEGLLLGGYPTCAWNQDVYKLWLAQNQNSLNFQGVTAAAKIVAGTIGAIATGGAGAVIGGGLLASGATDIANLLTQRADKEIQPPQAKGQASASINVAYGFQTFTLQRKSLAPEYARIIDDYFDMYGYKTQRVKIPNTHVRQNWTYTKTIGCNISGDFCAEDKTKIESIFNNGVTFWVNGDNIGNYALENGVI